MKTCKFIGVSIEGVPHVPSDVLKHTDALGRHSVAVRGLVTVLVDRNTLNNAAIGDYLRIYDFDNIQRMNLYSKSVMGVGSPDFKVPPLAIEQQYPNVNVRHNMIGRIYGFATDGSDECTVLLM